MLCTLSRMQTCLRTTISRVRFTQVMSYRLPPAPARCYAWILATLPITDIHRFNSLPSLYRSSSALATCYMHSPMESLLAIEVHPIWWRRTLLCCIHKKSPPADNVEVHLIGCLITLSSVRGLARHLCKLSRLFIFNQIKFNRVIFTLLRPSCGKPLHICGKLLRKPGNDHVDVCHTQQHKLHMLSHTVRKFRR